jgi:hypothetical protein
MRGIVSRENSGAEGPALPAVADLYANARSYARVTRVVGYVHAQSCGRTDTKFEDTSFACQKQPITCYFTLARLDSHFRK